MTKDVMISMLRQGKTGEQILQILDTIANDVQAEVMETVTAISDTIAEKMPAPGNIIVDVYGREVVF
jgi:hypothetical protein